MSGITLEFTDAQLTQLAAALAPKVARQLASRDGNAEPWPEWLTVETAAQYVGVGKGAIRKMYERGREGFDGRRVKLRTYQAGPGCRVYLRRSELDAYLAGKAP